MDRRTDGRLRHGRDRLGRGLRAALALTLLVVPLAAQSGEPDWRALYEELPDPDREPQRFAELGVAFLEEQEPYLATSPTAREYFGYVAYWLAHLPLTVDPDVELVHDLSRAFADVDARWAAEISYSMADRWVRQARYRGPERLIDDSLTLVPAGDDLRAFLQILRAEILRAQARWDDAQSQLAELSRELDAGAGEGWEPPLLDRVRARMHGVHAMIAVEIGVLHRASERLALEREHARASGDAKTWLAFLNHRVEYLLRTDQEQALLDLLEGPSAESPGGEPWERDDAALLALHRGVTHRWLSAIDATHVEPARQALEVALATSDPLRRSRARRELAVVALATGEVDRAATEIARARADLDAVCGGAPIEHLVFQRTAEASVALAVGRGRDELLSMRADLEDHFVELLDVWTAVTRPTGGASFFSASDRRQVADELMRLTLATEEQAPEERTLEVLLRLQSRGTRALEAGLRIDTVDELRAALGLNDRHGCLVLFPGDDRLNVFAIDGEHVSHEMALGYLDLRLRSEAIAAASRRHVESRRSGDGEDERRQAARILAAAEALSEDVLASSLPTIRSWQHVTVVGAEYLRGLPVELLVLPDGQLFGERWAVSSAPSLPLAASLARRARETEPQRMLDLVVALEPSPSARKRYGIEAYELDDDDLDPLRSAFDDELVRTTRDPTPAEVLRLDFGRSAIVQFLSHGVLDAGQIRPACLAFAGADASAALLRCDDLEQLSLAGVVVLTACGTALGPDRLGDDELAHLGGAVLRAGARSVVLSRAPIDLDWSLDFLRRVYVELAAGASVAEAVRRVRQDEAASSRDAWSRLDAAQLQVLGVATTGL